MKKIITSAVIIAACTALCALVWPQTDAGKEVPAEVAVSAMPAVGAESTPASETAYAVPEAEPVILAEKEKQFEADTSVITPDAAPAPNLAPKPVIPATTAADSSDPYHTDIYPNKVYSEEYLYDAEGNLIGKTPTIPTTFGPDAIWINGRACYDVPGFGLVEWSGPGQCTEAYNMYESGVKVGIMGDEDETPARTAAAAQPEICPGPTGEVIDQTINEVPERNSTPPDDKPNSSSCAGE